MNPVTLGNRERDSDERDSNDCGSDNRYDAVCKPGFENINTKLDIITNKLFVDNGGESYQSRLNRHDRWIKAVMAVIVVLGVSVLGIIADLIVRRFYQ